jgi:hypothetical protein
MRRRISGSILSIEDNYSAAAYLFANLLLLALFLSDLAPLEPASLFFMLYAVLESDSPLSAFSLAIFSASYFL